MEYDKTKIEKIMLDYLDSVGWKQSPNPDELVMTHLEPMFRLLVKEGLVQYVDYDEYVLAAQFQYAISRGV